MEDKELTPEEIFNAKGPEITVPKDLINDVPREEIIKKLIRLDYKAAKAEEIISKIEEQIDIVLNQPERVREIHKKVQEAFCFGFFFILIAIAIFYLTLGLGVIVFGVGLFTMGLVFIVRGSSQNTSLKEIQKLLKEKEDRIG